MFFVTNYNSLII